MRPNVIILWYKPIEWCCSTVGIWKCWRYDTFIKRFDDAYDPKNSNYSKYVELKVGLSWCWCSSNKLWLWGNCSWKDGASGYNDHAACNSTNQTVLWYWWMWCPKVYLPLLKFRKEINYPSSKNHHSWSWNKQGPVLRGQWALLTQDLLPYYYKVIASDPG